MTSSIIALRFILLYETAMSDTTQISQTQPQISSSPAIEEPVKKNFFGGEVNPLENTEQFQPINPPAEEFNPFVEEPEGVSVVPEEQVSAFDGNLDFSEQEKSVSPFEQTQEDIPSFENFDPFDEGESEESSQVEEKLEAVEVESDTLSSASELIDEVQGATAAISEEHDEEPIDKVEEIEAESTKYEEEIPEQEIQEQEEKASVRGFPESEEMEEILSDEDELEEVEQEEILSDEEEMEKEPESTQYTSSLFKKFNELVKTTREIFSLLSEEDQSFRVLGGKSGTSTLEYYIYLVEDEEENTDLFVRKVETDNQTQEETEHLLQWNLNYAKNLLNVFVDEILLFELSDEEDQKYQNDIIAKLYKFGFLFETHYQDLYKAYEEKKEGEEQKKQLQEIFRAF